MVDDRTQETATSAPPMSLQSVLDALPFYMLMVDDRHHILMANRAVSQALGKDPDSLIGQNCPRVIHGLDHSFPGCPLEEARDSGTAIERVLWDEEHRRYLKSCIYPTAERTPEGHRIFVHRVEDVTGQRTSEETLERNANTAAALNELLRLVNTDAPLPALLQQTLERVLSLPWLAIERKGAIFLAGEEPGTVVMKAQSGLAPALLAGCSQVRYGCCLCGRAAETREIQFADRLDYRHDVRYEGIKPHGHYCLPILRGEHLLGVLNIYVSEGHRRDPHEEAFLAAVTDVLATLIAKRSVDDELRATLVRVRQTLGGVIDVLVSMVESRDPYTAGHQRRVSDLSRAIATEMGLPGDIIEGIRVAGTVHDIGKVSVPSEILSRPGRLTALEYQLIQTHVTVGYNILKPVQFPWPVAESVLQHHERFDGSGYPAGLAGPSIRVEARILAVADVVEAMASHRPYRPALGIEKALEEVRRGRCTLYDSDVVDACVRLFEVKGYRLPK